MYDRGMNVHFEYDSIMEAYPLQVGFGGKNDSQHTEFAESAKAAGVVANDEEAISKFVTKIIADDEIDMDQAVESINKRWQFIQSKVDGRFGTMFDTSWSPNQITGYLTLSKRCPYHYPSHFWIYYATTKPVANCLHEIQHFYSHKLLLPIFEQHHKTDMFNDFKEAASVLLNVDFSDIMERQDQGYPQHQELRGRIQAKYLEGVSIATLARRYIAGSL